MPEEFPDGSPIENFGDLSESLWRIMRAHLRDTRIARRITLRQLSKDLGVHSTHLSRVERCETLPNVVLAIRWSLALHIDFGRLYHTSLNAGDRNAEIG